jgi:DNA repair protein RadC
MAEKTKHKGDGHRERLRYKFMGSGLSGFHDYEVIELLLTLGTPRKDCKEAAKAALAKFKTLQGVLDASDLDLCSVKGIGPMNLFGLRLPRAVADRYLQKKIIHKEPVSNSKALFDYLYLNMGSKDRECFKALFLDAKNRVIAVEDLFSGTLTASSVYPREVVRAALEHRAAAVIFAHNHPSGDPAPSPADFSITRQLIFACQTMGIVVHEHIVIGDNRYFSFADQGVITEINEEFKRAGSNNSYDKGSPNP